MATKKNSKKNSGIKKHDWLRIVGEPMMIMGHCATMVVGGELAKAATIAGAVMMTVWVTVEVIQFVKKRRKTANRRVQLATC